MSPKKISQECRMAMLNGHYIKINPMITFILKFYRGQVSNGKGQSRVEL